jgi:hypothetical protein
MSHPARPRRLLPAALVLALAALAAPGAAHAGYVPTETIDGPSPDILRMGDMDISRDGTGLLAYVRRDEGAPHVVVSRLVDGAWQAPERVDGGLPDGASPAVAASEGGRVAVAWISGGALWASVRDRGAAAFSPPQALADGASAPSLDMSVGGVGYVTFTVAGGGGGDVRAARLDRRTSAFRLLPDLLDVDGNSPAGLGSGRSKVAVAADGTAVAVWGEAGRVIARRIFDDRVSLAPQDMTAETVEDRVGAPTADVPDIDIEDDSSYAWATFRQRFDDGRLHIVARRLVGSAFDPPVAVDGFGFPAGADAASGRIDLNGRGEGIAVTGAGPAGVFSSLVHDDAFFPGAVLGFAAGDGSPVGAVADNNDAFAAYRAADGTLRARAFDINPRVRSVPPPGPEAVLSTPEFGPVEEEAGIDLAVDRGGNMAVAAVQASGPERRLVVAAFDRAPGAFRTYSSGKLRRQNRPTLTWQAPFELWGPLRYRVEVAGQVVGEGGETRLVPAAPLPDGTHPWRVVATDRRGQSVATKVRYLRVDATPPEVTATFKRSGGRILRVTATVADGALAAPAGSGVRTVEVLWGDGTRSTGRTLTHRYRRGGEYVVTVRATDRAGNVGSMSEEIRIKRK